VQPRRGARDVAFLQHGFEQHEQVEVDPSEINLVQHIAEIVSLDSSPHRD
jgi:hypothetical protein